MAHIGGIPVEETVATFAPVVAVAGGCCVASVRARLRRLRGAALSAAASTDRSARSG